MYKPISLPDPVSEFKLFYMLLMFDKGTTRIELKTDKYSYNLDENIGLLIDIDNSNCKLSVYEVIVSIIQTITLKTTSSKHKSTKVITK